MIIFNNFPSIDYSFTDSSRDQLFRMGASKREDSDKSINLRPGSNSLNSNSSVSELLSSCDFRWFTQKNFLLRKNLLSKVYARSYYRPDTKR